MSHISNSLQSIRFFVIDYFIQPLIEILDIDAIDEYIDKYLDN
jgi:hypothetical protein